MISGPELPGFFHVTALDTVDSTNEEAKRRAVLGAPEGTLIWAKHQLAGRGRRGRTWVSPEGNLYCSIILRPQVPAMEAAQLSFIASLALVETLDGAMPKGAEISCKWPNDVLVEGRKVAGILLESQAKSNGLEWMIVGIGVNIATYPSDEEVETPATSLRGQGGEGEAEDLLVVLAERFLAWFQCWRRLGFDTVRRGWLARAAGVGANIRVRLAGETLYGIFAGLDKDGTLLLDQAGGLRRKIAAGEIFIR